MSTIELEARKASLVREILTEVNDMELLEKLANYLKKNLKKEKEVGAPCQYTVEEMEERVAESMQSYHAGNYKTSDELRKRHPLCE